MELPKFLLADNSDFGDVFVLHTEYPRFLLNMQTDDIEWYDDVEDEGDLENQVKQLMDLAYKFFDEEITAYEDEDEDYEEV